MDANVPEPDPVHLVGEPILRRPALCAQPRADRSGDDARTARFVAATSASVLAAVGSMHAGRAELMLVTDPARTKAALPAFDADVRGTVPAQLTAA